MPSHFVGVDQPCLPLDLSLAGQADVVPIARSSKRMIAQAADTPVLFNLDGVDVWGGVSRAGGGRGGATDWELLQIYQNPDFPNLQFFQNGGPVPNPFK